MVYAPPKQPHRSKPFKPQLKQVPKNVKKPKKPVRPPKPPKQLKVKLVVRTRQRVPLPPQKPKPVPQLVEPKPFGALPPVHKLVQPVKRRRKLFVPPKVQATLRVKRRVKRVKKLVEKVRRVKQLPPPLLKKNQPLPHPLLVLRQRHKPQPLAPLPNGVEKPLFPVLPHVLRVLPKLMRVLPRRPPRNPPPRRPNLNVKPFELHGQRHKQGVLKHVANAPLQLRHPKFPKPLPPKPNDLKRLLGNQPFPHTVADPKQNRR